ncbi:hypothetical protein GQ43DRAFT_444522 [Delitschia confertaspora ATCC 74209]|uniref:HIT-type domain-containing protein n=1 Tax=Delitschia confertaspora ATCC 74209 TaxID=1513339 RepID=A0A9P4MUI7_9PLEO|nr:hypothetical protein GQ43DRAFT_444522 [Delitschia confertaspora ATCC 74209]
MADQTVLSELCSICNTNKFKYCCPGCAARTCSLPCYKRHQQWAQCSGKRDPTKYVKKSQLSTPAGIDHDFNFITGIERGLDRAEKNVKDRGIILNETRAPTKKGEVQRGHYAAAGVNVIKAPKGLSRQKDNTTHRSARGRIIWTVEWIHEDKSRTITETTELAPLLPTYLSITGHEAGLSKKKRKRAAQDQDEAQPVEKVQKEDGPAPTTSKTTEPTETETGNEEPKTSDAPAASLVANTSPQGPQPSAGKSSSEADPTVPLPTIANTQPQPTHPDYHFYLLKPRTNSQKRVLIPLSPSALLSESLRGQTVLEFPTIYVLTTPVESLPQDFMLEAQYLKQVAEEEKELEEALKAVDPEKLKALRGGEEGGKAEEVDSRAILDVLKMDAGALV